jgi:hypothetical protein
MELNGAHQLLAFAGDINKTYLAKTWKYKYQNDNPEAVLDASKEADIKVNGRKTK